MTNGEVHLELLLGKCVLDRAGKSVGRIQEVIAEQQGDEWVVREYLVGRLALFDRLSALRIGRALFGLFRAKRHAGGYRVPWDKLNLTDLEKPCLTCSCQELEGLSDRPKKKDQDMKKQEAHERGEHEPAR